MGNKYLFQKYIYPQRWISYWHQIDEVLKTEPNSVLVIGIGDGIVVRILKDYIPDVQTLDIDKDLRPAILASVDSIPLEDEKFDTILCAEVLEHLPFDKFEKCLSEIKRVVKKNVIISFPHFGPPIKFSFKIPFLSEVKITLKIPFPIKHQFNGEHYWELGKKGYSPRRIKNIIKKYFKIQREYLPFENQYHHFYVLEKL